MTLGRRKERARRCEWEQHRRPGDSRWRFSPGLWSNDCERREKLWEWGARESVRVCVDTSRREAPAVH